MKNTQYLFSASLMCANILKFDYQLNEIINHNIDFLHLDIMDFKFVPNLAMNFDMVNQLKSAGVPRDIHLMVYDIDTFLRRLIVTPHDIVTFHYEATNEHVEIIEKIKRMGCKVGIAINPETSSEVLFPLLSSLDLVTIMCVNPGFAGQKFVEGSYQKIHTLKTYFMQKKYKTLLSVDGNITHERIEDFMKNNIDMYVLGTSSLFNKEFENNLVRIQNYNLYSK